MHQRNSSPTDFNFPRLKKNHGGHKSFDMMADNLSQGTGNFLSLYYRFFSLGGGGGLCKQIVGEQLAQRRRIARLCTLCKPCSAERTWKAIRDRLRRPYYLSRVDNVGKIRDGKQRTDIGKYSFVNRNIKNWNQLLQKRLGLSLVNLRFLETDLGKQL